MRVVFSYCEHLNHRKRQKVAPMPLSIAAGEHAGSHRKPLNTWIFVGADLRVCPVSGSRARLNQKTNLSMTVI